ncbi:hypothetical protein HHK36_005172 [Tetracentron sinense]|uniref:Uncharacterized protein n=1 Tax=Tetracentron sinense TaxID=13715 RepID=A0A835DQH4_TETSI|nr:hypothetical protein HHK36_005172 [Tetracentron sinense]
MCNSASWHTHPNSKLEPTNLIPHHKKKPRPPVEDLAIRLGLLIALRWKLSYVPILSDAKAIVDAINLGATVILTIGNFVQDVIQMLRIFTQQGPSCYISIVYNPRHGTVSAHRLARATIWAYVAMV